MFNESNVRMSLNHCNYFSGNGAPMRIINGKVLDYKLILLVSRVVIWSLKDIDI